LVKPTFDVSNRVSRFFNLFVILFVLFFVCRVPSLTYAARPHRAFISLGRLSPALWLTRFRLVQGTQGTQIAGRQGQGERLCNVSECRWVMGRGSIGTKNKKFPRPITCRISGRRRRDKRKMGAANKDVWKKCQRRCCMDAKNECYNAKGPIVQGSGGRKKHRVRTNVRTFNSALRVERLKPRTYMYMCLKPCSAVEANVHGLGGRRFEAGELC
jgi:hypothetical protein